MSIKPLEIHSKKIHIMKAVTGANYKEKTILTNSAWEYVNLWLRRAKGDRAKQALFFWNQAHNFFIASEQLPIESRPLTYNKNHLERGGFYYFSFPQKWYTAGVATCGIIRQALRICF